MTWTLVFSKQSQKDVKKCRHEMCQRIDSLLKLLTDDPFKIPPPFEPLLGQLKGAYSRRINIQHRLVYSVNRPEKVVRIHRCWSHYE